ncbi:hypothetical protein JXB12_10545 [candidate division KSB1 bacterium]|nr:hypothetical protein [candidate division KSB1 bacterium]
MMSKKSNFPLIIIIFIALIVYALNYVNVCNNLQISTVGDAQEYIKCAENTIDHGLFYCGDLDQEIDYDLFTRRTPFYPLILIIFLKLTHSIRYVLFFQTFLVFINAYLLLKILMLRNTGKRYSYPVIAVYLFYPSQWIFSTIVMTEIVLQFLLLASFYLLFKFELVRSSKLLIVYNMILALAVLTKPVLLYVWILNLVFHLVLAGKKSRHLVAYSLIALVAIGLWSYRNYRATGVYHYSSIKMHNLLNYNVRYLLTKKYGSDEANERIAQIETEAGRGDNYKAFYDRIQDEAIRIIKQHPVEYGIYHIKGMFNFFLDPGRFEIYHYLQIDQTTSLMKLYHEKGYSGIYHYIKTMPVSIVLYLSVMFIVNSILFILFILFIINLRRCHFKSIYELFLLLMILYFALVTGPIGASRFRVPILPFLLLTGISVLKGRKVKTTDMDTLTLNS